MDNIEIFKCAQPNTYNAALRFEVSAYPQGQSVTNSVIRDSYAWGALLKSARFLTFNNNTIVGSRQFGLNLLSIQNNNIESNFIGDTQKRKFTTGDVLDKESCVGYCSFTDNNSCKDNVFMYNIAAGCPYAGFVAPGHECDEVGNTEFKDNVAHSIDGNGAIIYPKSSNGKHRTCYEGSYFTAYKVRENGVATHFASKEIRMSRMTFIDQELGVSLQTAGEGDEKLTMLKQSTIYGDFADNTDCPGGQTAYRPKIKSGLMLFTSNTGGKPLHITMPSAMPFFKIKTDGAYGGHSKIENVRFEKFDRPLTKCGSKQVLFTRNKYAADYIPMHEFSATTFVDVHEEAVAFLKDPDPGWAVNDDCGTFPCTAPNNIVLKFTRSRFSGIRPVQTASEFQIVSYYEKSAGAFSDCEPRAKWNAQICKNRNLGVLLFESLDADKMDRSIQPVYIKNQETGYVNKLNSFMDHVWDGFYTG